MISDCGHVASLPMVQIGNELSLHHQTQIPWDQRPAVTQFSVTRPPKTMVSVHTVHPSPNCPFNIALLTTVFSRLQENHELWLGSYFPDIQVPVLKDCP